MSILPHFGTFSLKKDPEATRPDGLASRVQKGLGMQLYFQNKTGLSGPVLATPTA